MIKLNKLLLVLIMGFCALLFGISAKAIESVYALNLPNSEKPIVYQKNLEVQYNNATQNVELSDIQESYGAVAVRVYSTNGQLLQTVSNLPVDYRTTNFKLSTQYKGVLIIEIMDNATGQTIGRDKIIKLD